MSHVLDRPIWNALTTAHAALAEGDALARRYPPAIVPFAAAADASAASQAALAGLARPEETMAMVETEYADLPPGLALVRRDALVQMLGVRAFPRMHDARVVPLGADDAEDMLALATLTRPGPFTLRSQALGLFWGIRDGGRLVAMAGQRLRVSGFAELSGLCTHPDHQRQGLATLLLNVVAGEIAAGGETPFLHAYAANRSTIAFYERMGFRVRSEMRFTIVQRPA